MSIPLAKTTRKGKAIVVILTQDDDRDRISVTVDIESLELDEEASAGRSAWDPRSRRKWYSSQER